MMTYSYLNGDISREARETATDKIVNSLPGKRYTFVDITPKGVLLYDETLEVFLSVKATVHQSSYYAEELVASQMKAIQEEIEELKRALEEKQKAIVFFDDMEGDIY